MIFYRRWHKPVAVSFDLDDTLYDNTPVLLHAEQQLQSWLVGLDERFHDWRLADWASHRRQVAQQQPELRHDMTALRSESMRQALLSLGHQLHRIEVQLTQGMELFLYYRNQIQLEPAVVRLLEQLADHYPLVAITNGNADPERFGLKGLFSSYHQPGGGARMKPSADLFVQAQQQHQFHGDEWLHIGDHTRADVFGAVRMGWQACWLNNRAHRRPLQLLPHIEIGDISQLQPLLLD